MIHSNPTARPSQRIRYADRFATEQRWVPKVCVISKRGERYQRWH